MLIKKLLILISFLSLLEAHRIPGISLDIKKTKNEQIQIEAFFKRSKKPLIGNEVRLISMFDNRVLNKGKTSHKKLVLDIPDESYWVYLIVRDNDIVVDGLPPKDGFKKIIKKEKIALLYTLLITCFLIFTSFLIAYKKKIRFKNSET